MTLAINKFQKLKQIGFIILLILSFSINLSAQKNEKTYNIQWDNSIQNISAKDFIYLSESDFCPYFFISEQAENNKTIDGEIVNIKYEKTDSVNLSKINKLTFKKELHKKQLIIKKINTINFEFPAIRFNENLGQFERVISVTILYNQKVKNIQTNLRGNNWKSVSKLSNGDWYKIKISNNSVYKIDYNFLKNAGIPVDQINPQNIQIFGNGGGMLPMQNNIIINDDLEEMSIYVSGEQDGKFDPNDYILFYGKGQLSWNYNNSSQIFNHQQNYYTNESYFFINIGSSSGKRIKNINESPGSSPQIVNSFDDFILHEVENENPFKSGKVFLGEKFDKTTEYSFNEKLTDIILSEDIYLNSSTKARSFTNSEISLDINGSFIGNHSLPFTYPDQGAYYYTESSLIKKLKLNTDQISIRYIYNKPMVSSMAWLDYYELQYRRNLLFGGGQLLFRDSKSIYSSSGRKFEISLNTNNASIWDVTNNNNHLNIQFQNISGKAIFYSNDTLLHEYIIFDGSVYGTPTFVGKVSNQNLHGINNADIIILTHSNFYSASLTLAEYRESQGKKVVVVTPEQIYNEFSSGAQDISAIRNFVKMIYDRAPLASQIPQSLLIMGDGSFDYKNSQVTHDNGGKITKYDNTNFVPTFESDDSYSSSSYCSDDYYGFLDDGEGNWGLYDQFGLDIGIGRLPVKTESQAKQMVDKIINFESNKSFGDWRTKAVIIGDDEDYNAHLINAEAVSNYIEVNSKNTNVVKLYLDAYPKVISNGVPSYPELNLAFKNYLKKGCMFVNYSGHGGPNQWAHENIINTDLIKNLNNYNNLPLFMAATCDFGPWDDVTITSAGEWVVLNPNGGGIAILSTTRIANTGQNTSVNQPFFHKNIYLRDVTSNKFPNLGEAYRIVKNRASNWIKNFCLLGDPSLNLMIPEDTIIITKINGHQANSGLDTLKALMKVTIEGEIRDYSGNISNDFNGTIYPTVYDKRSNYQTLGNEPKSNVTTFSMQNNIVYKGKATVNNGKFNFTFIVPKDINYKTGFGKLSLYAHSNSEQAWGADDKIILGGTNDTIAIDQKGPEVRLYLNDDKWVTGGTTHPNPIMLVKLFDESGINTVGNGVGRNLTATLDNGSAILVNDYYQAKENDFTQGEIKYPLSGLSEGKHILSFKAWDVYNNSSEVSTEFYVSSDANIVIKNLLNYPNPFFGKTTFHFEHNKAGQPMDVQIQIMNINGQVIKNLQANFTEAPGHFEDLSWDGLDEYGDKVGRGVYVYVVKIKDSQGNIASEIQKLVILQ